MAKVPRAEKAERAVLVLVLVMVLVLALVQLRSVHPSAPGRMCALSPAPIPACELHGMTTTTTTCYGRPSAAARRALFKRQASHGPRA